jgi:RimJ/RimL family protein N-acetyltransferase
VDLIGPLVRLRGPRSGDARALVALRSDPEVLRFAISPYFAPTRADHISESLSRRSSDDVRWVVERRQDRAVLGSSVLHRLDFRNRNCWFGIELPGAVWTSDDGVEAIRLTTGFAFRQMGLEKVYASVVEDDLRALRAHRDAGYEVEARLARQRLLTSGNLVTELWLAAYRDHRPDS